ncbi:MAG: tetratricopeptide repeat protein [Rhodospirillaceae bacterium]|nr:tetratricopeptide repeat protein [Rhodospirillaceae bacterium]
MTSALQQALSFHRMGDLASAERLYVQAQALDPADFTAWYLLGGLRLQQGRSAEALASFDRTLALNPNQPEALAARGGVLRGLGRFGEALESYDKAIALRPQQAELFYNRGLVCLELQRRQEALADFDRALALKADYVDAWNARGGTQYALGHFGEALASFDRAIVFRPQFAALHHNRGLALQKMARSEDALASYDRALALRPGDAEAWNDRGFALKTLKQRAEALASFARALAIAPHHAGALHNRGATFWDLGRYDEALADFNRALALAPDSPWTLHNRGNLLWESKKLLEPALRDLERAVALDPHYAYARGEVLHLRMYGGDWRGLAEELPAIDRCVRHGEPAIKPFMYQAVSDSPADLYACAKLHAARDYPVAAEVRVKNTRRPGKIRLGYMCGEFRLHATALLTAGLYEAHDRDRFEVTAFDTGAGDDSSLRRRLEAAFDKIIDVSALGAPQAARRVADEDIDILVNLNGYYGAHRMDVFAHRPAPVQVTFLGFPGTLGAPYIDYIVADRVVIPEQERPFYAEQVVYLPDCYQVNDARRETPEAAADRAQFGLPPAAFVYCHFNHNYKLMPATFARWMSILRRTEGSVLWLLQSSEPFAGNIRRAAARHGIAEERLIFAPVLGQREHLARLPLGDLFLDSHPCNAHTTASDALWMGLPLLTYAGNCFSGRVAASLLRAVGLPELVADSPQAYEELAVALAKDPVLLKGLRQELAENRKSAPLFDTGRFTRHIESGYATMFDRWQSGRRPESFSVTPLA